MVVTPFSTVKRRGFQILEAEHDFVVILKDLPMFRKVCLMRKGDARGAKWRRRYCLPSY